MAGHCRRGHFDPAVLLNSLRPLFALRLLHFLLPQQEIHRGRRRRRPTAHFAKCHESSLHFCRYTFVMTRRGASRGSVKRTAPFHAEWQNSFLEQPHVRHLSPDDFYRVVPCQLHCVALRDLRASWSVLSMCLGQVCSLASCHCVRETEDRYPPLRRKHYHQLFRLNHSQISVLNVASRFLAASTATTTRTGRHRLLFAGVPSARCGRATPTTCHSTTSLASQRSSNGGYLRRPSRGSAFSCAPRLQEGTSPTPKPTFKQIWSHQLCDGCCMTSSDDYRLFGTQGHAIL